jgi:uncharacterized integral membrane protein
MGILLLILAIIMLASLQEQVDLDYLKKDYEKWKRDQR